MEQGTGKTIPALCRILDLLKGGKIDDALVVAPKSALGAWERDMDLFDPLDRQILSDGVVLINYDKVWRGADQSPYYKKWGAIVLDEAHNIKNRSSNRSKFLHKIGALADYRYILTGTPISNGCLEDIWSEFCFLECEIVRGWSKSKIFGSYRDFTDRYCILNMYHKPSAYVHVDELQDIINSHSYRVKKSECLDLPDKLPDELIKIKLSDKSASYYRKLATTSAIIADGLEILAENPLTRLLKLRQIASGFITDDAGKLITLNNDKISALDEILDGFTEDKKIVIFAEFKESIKNISSLLDHKRYNYVVLDGEQKNKKIWREFQNDASLRVIVCQYLTANAGIDLYASDTIIYYEPTLRSVILEQSRDRIHRSGQTHKCSYIHILTKGSVEVDIYRALAGYADFTENLFSEYMEQYRRGY